MESGVERVRLYGELTLDIEALTKYSGQGRCWEVRLDRPVKEMEMDTAASYREELRTWARVRNWKVPMDKDGRLVINKFR